jgi:hypothetical protein
MRRHIISLIVATLLISSILSSVAHSADLKSITEVINQYKSQIVDLDKFDADAKEYFIKSYMGRSPGIVKGDFNGDGKTDVALLTRSALLFFICEEQCTLTKSIDYGSFAGYQFIVPIKKCKLIEEPGIDEKALIFRLRLKNTAVHLIFYGKASIAYYWHSEINDFDKLVTGD